MNKQNLVLNFAGKEIFITGYLDGFSVNKIASFWQIYQGGNILNNQTRRKYTWH